MRLLNYKLFKVLNENLSESKRLMAKLGLPLEDKDFKQMQTWLINNSGYLPWFTKLRFQDKVSMQDLEKLWLTIKNNKRVIAKFDKPVISLATIEDFWTKYKQIEESMLVKSIYNELLPMQKEFIDLEDPKDKKLLVDLSKDKDKKIFIRKSKRYLTRAAFINSLSNHLYRKTTSDFDELISKLENSGVEIWHADKEQDIIACTVNFEQLTEFASDTGWCTLEKSQFEIYNNEFLGRQWLFFLLDHTDAYSKIGASPFLGQDSKIRFSDCRLKGDISLPIAELYRIIESRGCSKDIFYKSMKNHFKNKETNIDFLPVETLLLIGLDRKEILSRKKRFREEDLSLLNDSEKKLITKSISYQQKDDEVVSELLSKLSSEQQKWFNLKNENDYNLLLTVSKDKKCDDFIQNCKFLTSMELLKASFEKFAYVKDKYDYDTLKSSLIDNKVKILLEDKENNIIIVPLDSENLQKVAQEFKFKIPEKIAYEGYKSPHIELELMIFKVGLGDIFSRIQLDVIFYQKRLVSNRIDDFYYKYNLVNDVDGRQLPVNFTTKLLLDLLLHLKIKKESIDKFMKNHILELENWNSLSVEMLHKLGFNKEEISTKKDLFIEEDIEKIGSEFKIKIENTNSLFVNNVLTKLPKKLKQEYSELDPSDKELVNGLFIELNLLGTESMKTFLSTIENLDYLQDLCANLNKFISLKKWQNQAKS